MDVAELINDFREGRIDGERLIALIVAQQRMLEAANRRIAELERELGAKPTQKLDESFSVDAEERRQEQRKKKRRKRKKRSRRGRITTAEKVAQAARTEKVFPEGVPQDACKYSHTRPVWRLENGRAILVAYEIHRGPGHRYGQIPGVLGRSEFGLEIVIAIAYQVFVVGLSFDKVCLLMNFFQNLTLSKAQANALLNQLARYWEEEFDHLCTLLANSAIVHADETGWSIKSVWAFLSEKVRILFFGVPKDAATLAKILDPASFTGIAITDDAAIYSHFTHAQKCWAHLLRKAIKLTLLHPDNEEYRRFADRLLEIYREACRVQRDRRFGDAGRAAAVAALEDEILELCGPMWCAELPPLEGPQNDYRLLVNELMRLMIREELFTFVTAAPAEMPNGQPLPVPGTNNEAERAIRGVAEARKTGRTNKTLQGAWRRTIIVSVLESLRRHLPVFNLCSVIEEILRWARTGESCFAELVRRLQLPSLPHSPLDQVLPNPGG